jgi:DNA invertase Pin-like site-specific DNA recombinase
MRTLGFTASYAAPFVILPGKVVVHPTGPEHSDLRRRSTMSAFLSTRNGIDPQALVAEERNLAVALLRISDDKQDSLPTQREWSQRVCQRDGLTLVNEFEDEGISGAAVTRPGLEELAEFVKQRFFAREPIRYLLVLDLDRFLRRDSISTGAWLEKLRTHGLRYIVTNTQRFDLHNSLDRTLIALGSDFTREPELRAKSNHTLNGMAERARNGYWTGGPVPYAYRAVDAPGRPADVRKWPRVLVLGPAEEQDVVRWIWEEYAAGRVTSIGAARRLNARGVPGPRGARWTKDSILGILCNRAYLGWIVWGKDQQGRYHKVEKGMVVPREDKHDREQQQLLRGQKDLPCSRAAAEDLIICKGAHPAIIKDEALFDACAARRERNKKTPSAPRGEDGNVWPLGGQVVCGHCKKPVWVVFVPGQPRTQRTSALSRARFRCSARHKEPGTCPHSGTADYAEVLDRVIALLQRKLAEPGAVEELAREYERQLQEHSKSGEGERRRLVERIARLDHKIARAVGNLLEIDADLRADAAEYVRGLKAERDTLGATLRDRDASQREQRGPDPADFRATLEMVQKLSAAMDSRDEAELLRATLRDLVAQVRLYFRPWQAGDPRHPGCKPPQRVVRRVEVDLTPAFADLLSSASR